MAKKKPAKRPQTFALTLTGPQRDTLTIETNIRGTLRKRLEIQATDTRTFNLTRSQLHDLNAIAGHAADKARLPHKKQLQAILGQIGERLGVDQQELIALRAKSKAAKPIPRRKAPNGLPAGKTGDSQAVYQLKITLLDTAPPIWRRIQIKDCTLDTLHHYIQAVMEWTNSHMHHFWIGRKRYGRPSLNVGFLPDEPTIWLAVHYGGGAYYREHQVVDIVLRATRPADFHGSPRRKPRGASGVREEPSSFAKQRSFRD